jgi:hypothetical protein
MSNDEWGTLISVSTTNVGEPLMADVLSTDITLPVPAT